MVTVGLLFVNSSPLFVYLIALPQIVPMKTMYTLFAFVLGSFTTVASTTMYMNYGGVQRDFIVHLPTGNVSNLPVVFNFHGYTSNAAQQELYTGMDNTADAHHFMVVYPDGIANEWNVGWTGTYGTGTNDVGFVSALIDTLYQLYHIDLTRVYATGLSNGGYLSHRLACELENRIAAIAAVSGTLTDSTYFYCTPSRIMPIMHIHGTTDPIVPYSGVTGSLSTEQCINYWLTKNICAIPGDTTNITNSNTGDGSTAQSINYPNCSNNTRVLFYKITGGGHTWPGGTFDIIPFGNTNRDMNANTEIWNFFSQYSWSGASGVTALSESGPPVKVYPNPFTNDLNIETDGRFRQMEVFNVLGEKVFDTPLSAVHTAVNLAGIKKGVYFIKLTGKDFISTQRIVKD